MVLSFPIDAYRASRISHLASTELAAAAADDDDDSDYHLPENNLRTGPVSDATSLPPTLAAKPAIQLSLAASERRFQSRRSPEARQIESRNGSAKAVYVLAARCSLLVAV